MKTHIILSIICIIGLITFMSCASQTLLLNPTGDTASVTLLNQTVHIGELLAINDTTIYIKIISNDYISTTTTAINPRIASISIGSIKSIEIKGYSNTQWKTGLILFEVIPSILMGIAAHSYSDDNNPFLIAGVLSIPTLLNLALFKYSTPEPPRLDHPIESTHLEKLKKYARFPQGLSMPQLKQLLSINKQSNLDYYN